MRVCVQVRVLNKVVLKTSLTPLLCAHLCFFVNLRKDTSNKGEEERKEKYLVYLGLGDGSGLNLVS